MTVIAFGNAFDGLTLVGPFDDAEAAITFAEQHAADGEDWHLVDVMAPDAEPFR